MIWLFLSWFLFGIISIIFFIALLGEEKISSKVISDYLKYFLFDNRMFMAGNIIHCILITGGLFSFIICYILYNDKIKKINHFKKMESDPQYARRYKISKI